MAATISYSAAAAAPSYCCSSCYRHHLPTTLLLILVILISAAPHNWAMTANLMYKPPGISSAPASASPAHTDTKQLHIVYMGAVAKDGSPFEQSEAVDSHVNLLSTHLHMSKEAASHSLALSYHKSFNGFAAMLTPKEAESLQGNPNVVSVFKNQIKEVLTTRSWDYVGLTTSSPRNPTVEGDLIVGVIDTGVWPENPMFSDSGFDDIPASWKGECTPGSNFTKDNCNKKLIGAKYFYRGIEAEMGSTLDNSTDFISARDNIGHGSHTASTAAGSMAMNASLYGLAKGNARGGVTGARVAIYKACWTLGCADADILAAFDEAIHDGIHLLSVSLGEKFNSQYFEDSIAIGSFHAMHKGILVSCAAGNAGNTKPTINIAPWILTVAASAINRQFYSPITLGNNMTIKGVAVNTFTMKDEWYPLISGFQGAFPNSTNDLNSCGVGVLDPASVGGKVVYCDVSHTGGNIGVNVLEANGSGLIYNTYNNSVGFTFVLPTSTVNTSEAEMVYEYINKTSEPVAKISPCEVSTINETGPLLAPFSSRGPHQFTPSVMKPDLSAPGVDIIAAWSNNSTVTGFPSPIDNRMVQYNIISGTSMSTPHATGAAAYVKSMHPDWSPAAIKSALMTTATPFDPSQEANKVQEFGYGSGQINPTKAADPGLIYDLSYNDYVKFLCTHGLNSTDVSLIAGQNVTCTDSSEPATLNYPAIVGVFTLDEKDNWYMTTRTLTNVGNPANLTYTIEMYVPGGMEVIVTPNMLTFNKAYETQSFQVAIRAPSLGRDKETTTISTSLVWTSPMYTVRSPIVAHLLSF